MTSQQPDPHIEAVAGLGRQLEALERSVADLSQLQPEVMRHARIIEQIARRLATAEDGDKGGAATWLGFDGDTDTAEAILSQLVAWTRDIYLRYSDASRSLPACWIWHPDVVEELLWLRQSWVLAYGPHARPSDVGDWHDRQRPGVVRRIKSYAGTCSIEGHIPGAKDNQSKPGPVVIFDDAVPGVAAWWANERTQPGPAPTEEQLLREKINTSSKR